MANFMKRNGKWQARVSWRDASGKLHQKSKAGFATKAQAKLYATELESELGKGVDVSADPVFADYFEQWYKTYREPHLSPASKAIYTTNIRVVRSYFKSVKIKSITRNFYQQFINAYGKSRAKNTVRRTQTYIRACVRSAMADGIISRDFTHDVKIVYNDSSKRNVEYLSIDELKRLTKVVNDNLSPDNIPAYMILTAIYTGARFSEILGLMWDDVDFENKTIHINKALDYHHGRHTYNPTKTPSSVRTIRVNSKLLNQFKKIPKTSDRLFDVNGTSHFNTHVNIVLQQYLKQAGVNKPSFHFHSLRHTHVAYLLSQGVDLYAISKRLGHANMSVTSNTYAYFIDEYKRKSDDQIESKLDEI
ncbi:tyrosine-type recombinase/integrase [Limosilactobacillus allomucosae]|uniref:tyrosine-type recombinase/integrase n=1 Tax=Limosilactobacillus allomucosae TaxID=3142938 RepID=UPI0032678681